MKKTFVAVFLALVIHSADAQVPGYMGLKFSIQYQGSISPQWNNFAQSFLPYYSHNVQVGYVVSRRYEVGVQYTRIDYSSGFVRNIENYDEQSEISIDHRTFTGNNVTAYLKIFREQKGFIAPLGRYYLLGLTYQNSRDVFHVTQDAGSSVRVPNYTTVQSHDVAIAFGVGRNMIFCDRLLLSIEGDVSIPVTSGIRAAMNSGADQDANSTINGVHLNANTYKYQNAIDVMLVNLVQIKIGLGFLAF